MSKNGNKKKDQLLGQPHGTAQGKLRKMLLYKFVKMASGGKIKCFRCGEDVQGVEDFSIEHTKPWMTQPDPKTAFFDLDDIAFSHLKCNVRAGEKGCGNRNKTHCKRGHEFSEDNTRTRDGYKRQCRKCRMVRKSQGLSWG